MTDRLDRILGELGDVLDGKRRLPVVRPADAEAVCGLFHAEVDRGTAARARAVEAAGRRVACHDGCSQCCNNIPAVFAAEAITIARWLERPENAAARAGFVARYPAWFAQVADLVERWSELTAAGDVEAGRETATEAWRRQVMCAFNHEGRCTVYPVRPIICRKAHALDTEANCVPRPAAPPATAAFAPLDDYVEHLQPVVFAMHRALRGDDRGSQPVCVAVHDALGGPGRNDPCPCGSGKKYKHCHLGSK